MPIESQFGEMQATQRMPFSEQMFCYGKVLQNQDTDHPNQIKVQLSALYETTQNEVWANLAIPYGGEAYGISFVPEVEEQVLLALVSGEAPVVLSSIWGKQKQPKSCQDNPENQKKIIQTKGGNFILFQDEEKKAILRLQTADGFFVEIADESQTVTISDAEQKNTLELNAKSGTVTVKAEKKISWNVGGKEVFQADKNQVTIKSGAVTVQADQKLEEKGGQVKISGTAVEVEANANMMIKSNGVTQMDSILLKLNG